MLLSDHVNIVLRVCKGSREIKFLLLMFLGLQNEPSKINGNLQIRQPQLLVTHHSFIKRVKANLQKCRSATHLNALDSKY